MRKPKEYKINTRVSLLLFGNLVDKSRWQKSVVLCFISEYGLCLFVCCLMFIKKNNNNNSAWERAATFTKLVPKKEMDQSNFVFRKIKDGMETFRFSDSVWGI